MEDLMVMLEKMKLEEQWSLMNVALDEQQQLEEMIESKETKLNIEKLIICFIYS
jgi:hypothetical protein